MGRGTTTGGQSALPREPIRAGDRPRSPRNLGRSWHFEFDVLQVAGGGLPEVRLPRKHGDPVKHSAKNCRDDHAHPPQGTEQGAGTCRTARATLQALRQRTPIDNAPIHTDSTSLRCRLRLAQKLVLQ